MFARIIGFLLRPLIRPIRYGALKLMKKVRAPNDRRPIIATSDHILSEFVLPLVFNLFQEDKFRERASFSKLPTVEHDRIFNELEVAGICLAMFYLRAVKSLVRPENYHFWQEVEEHLPKQLQKIMLGFGISGSNAKLMRQLVDMRRAEYEELAKIAQNINIEHDEEFRALPPEMKWFAAAMQATAVGTVKHIRRGKYQEKEPLVQYLVEWLMRLRRKISRLVKNL
ncbi:MAG: hypothetical protein HY978_00020 [Candidatus Liptonbacteria bacterium]|nr:hypothetical protein [Candidatus Liptonbacteria bacterium]